MKECSKCYEEKHLSLFKKDKAIRSGYASICKVCHNKKVFARSKTKTSVINRIFGNQKVKSIKRGHEKPQYDSLEFKQWMLKNEDFNELYQEWENSGYISDLIPSVDRLDDYKGYYFNNIRVVTWRENNKRGHEDMIKGINRKSCKKVVRFSKDGKKIDDFFSTKEAERRTGIKRGGISAACLRPPHRNAGFMWRYEKDII